MALLRVIAQQKTSDANEQRLTDLGPGPAGPTPPRSTRCGLPAESGAQISS